MGWKAVQRYYEALKKDGNISENMTLSVNDAVTDAPLWSRDFAKEAPRVYVEEYEGTMALSWAVRSEHAKAEIKADPKLKERLAAMGEDGRVAERTGRVGMRVGIAGAGNVGRSVARELLEYGHKVLLIERERRRFEPATVPGADWLNADAERTQPGAAWNSSIASSDACPPRTSQRRSHSGSEPACTEWTVSCR